MFWAGIVEDTLLGPFKVPEGVKMNYQQFLSFCQSIFYHGTGHRVVLISRNLYLCRIMLQLMHLAQQNRLSIKKHR